jgi:DNA invertase Pin-like site-specific DNA recombinase
MDRVRGLVVGDLMTNYVTYLRVSTDAQGKSGLGLEAQQAAIDYFLRPDDKVVATFTEIESGRCDARPMLAKAIVRCKKTGSTLLLAKLDRLARSVKFISTLMTETDFRVADMPHASPFELHIRASVAEEEARMISQRTKAALAAAKKRGVKLGGDRGYRPPIGSPLHSMGGKASGLASAARATRAAYSLASVIGELQSGGITSYRGLAIALNERQIPTPRGKAGSWTATSVRRVLARLAAAGAD